MIAIRHIKSNDSLEGLYQVRQGIEYSALTGQKLTVIYPWATDCASQKPRLPLVVFVQGSGWATPDTLFQLPQLCEFARRGYVVASVVHRSIFDGAACPAQLIDVKCAIRFLRANAMQFGIDASRVAIWGTSSGAHIAQLVGVTAGMAQFESPEFSGEPDGVSAVVSCFGPCDLAAWIEFNRDNPECIEHISHLLDGSEKERFATARAVSPISYVPDRQDDLPSFFLSVGTDDQLVELSQVTRMADALGSVGASVEVAIVDGALHESTFWSQDMLNMIWEYLDRYLT